nr:immunoglobulin heavy chain junction region [Mus musculus]
CARGAELTGTWFAYW